MKPASSFNRLLLNLIICLLTVKLFAQSTVVHPVEQVDPKVAYFPIIAGSEDPGYTGDLNLNIPLLTIPGRGGLNYDVKLEYVNGNGIPASESPSWVGLGWNINDYSVTCNPNYDITIFGLPPQPPYQYINRATSNQSDFYFLSWPGGSTQIRKFNDGNWYPLKWSAIKISPDNYVESEQWNNNYVYKDYKRFIITDVDGTKYVFGSSLRNISVKRLRNHTTPDGTYSPLYAAYYYVHKLTAILSPNYVDAGGDPYVPEDAINSDKGNWVKIDYSETEVIEKSADEYIEVNYIDQILTPTHKAIFNLDTENDIFPIFSGQMKSGQQYHILDNIELMDRQDDTTIKTVKFYTSDKFSWVEQEPGSFFLETNSLRRGLDSLKIYGQNNTETPAYSFNYNNNPDLQEFNDTYPENQGIDGWGLYTIQRNATHPDTNKIRWTCWLLNEVNYPTGGKMSLEYESDAYQPYLYQGRGNGLLVQGIISGGVRLKSKTLYDPVKDKTYVETYRYGLTNPLLPGYGFVSCEPFIMNDEGNDTEVVTQMNSNDVHYPDIEITRPDGTIIKRYYTSAFSNSKTSSNSIDPFLYDYSAYGKNYNTINNPGDSFIQSYTQYFNSGFFTGKSFGNLIGTKLNTINDIYYEENKEFDDEVIAYRQSGIDQWLAFRLFDNSWKRGFITKEEVYAPDYLNNPPFKPIEAKEYYYTMIPVKTDSYIQYIFYTSPWDYNAFTAFTTSGWAQLTDIVTYKYNDLQVNVVSYTYNSVNGLVEKQTTKPNLSASNNCRIEWNNYYFSACQDMFNRHMLSQKSFTVLGDENSTFNNNPALCQDIFSLTSTEWSNQLSGDVTQWYPQYIYKWDDLDNDNEYDGTSENKIETEYTIYDLYGNELEFIDANGCPTSVKWGYSNSLPVAVVKGGRKTEIAYDGFEDGSTIDWNFWTSGGSIGSTAHTGQKAWHFTNTSAQCITKRFLASEINTSGKYVYSGWVKSSSTQPVLQWEIVYNNGNSSTYPGTISSSGSGTWEQLELNLDLSTFPNIVAIYLYARNQSGTPVACDFDDLRFYPRGSQMITFSNDQYSYNLISKSGPNNMPKYFDYDGLQRLSEIKDNNKTTTNTFLYDLKGEAISSANPNFINSYSYRSAEDYTELKEFYDGLGRKTQSQVKLNGTESIILNSELDALGRDSALYKAYQHSSSLNYETNVQNNAKNYYNNYVYNGSTQFTDDYPYTTKEYFSDGRIKSLRPEGYLWKDNHFISYLYEEGYEVGRILDKTTITDENGVKNIDLYDHFGNLVEKVSNSVLTVTDASSENLITKYEYNVVGKLTKSIPPAGESFSSNYTYNTLQQLTEKSTPDQGTVKYLYDKNGNVRFIQDANHYSTSVNNVNIQGEISRTQNLSGSFTLSGKGKLDLSLNLMLMEITSGSVTLQIKGPDNVVLYSIMVDDENYISDGSLILPKGSYSYFISSTAYSEGSIDYSIICNVNYVFVYNKYDALNRITESGEYCSSSLGSFSQVNAEDQNFPTSNKLIDKKFYYDIASTDPMAAGQKYLKGRISYTESYSQGSLAIKTFYSYSPEGWVEWMVHYGLGWYNKKLTYSYDLQGNVTDKSFRDYYSTSYMYTHNGYDAAGRLNLVETRTTPTGDYQQDAFYEYFASGKLKRLQLANLQGLDYRYNERDWLTMINHQNLGRLENGIPQDPGRDGFDSGLPADKFGMVIDYNRIGHIGLSQNVQAQWNGNISWLMYRMSGVNYSGVDLVGYTFSYDNMNRLKASDFGYYTSSWQTTNAYDENSLSYDKNGNILTVNRNGSNGYSMDNFGYLYNQNTNKLSRITVYEPEAEYDYSYDNNGNVCSDESRGISFIIYNADNLPETVYKTNGEKQNYSYDVNGNRIRKNVVGGTDIYYINGADGKTETVSYSYLGNNYAYNIWGNDMIGQIRKIGATISKYYFLKDHLGSIRMTINTSGTVVGYDDYYPYGAIMPERSQVSSSDTKYKFTGKERDAETGYDYFGARSYDSRIGRWLSVDPLADKYPGWSPYNYTMNNPLKYVDPNGMWSAERDENGNIIARYEDGDTYENLYTQLGLSAEQFASWTSSQGIQLSLDGSGMSFNITDFVVSNNNFDANFSGSNCHGFVAFATGNTPFERQIGGQDLITTLGSPSQTSIFQTGNVAVFPLDENLVQNDGTITLAKGDPAHSAIFVLKNQSGEAQYLNRINTGQPVSISSGSQIVSFFNNLSQQYSPMVRQMPYVVPNPSFYKVK